MKTTVWRLFYPRHLDTAYHIEMICEGDEAIWYWDKEFSENLGIVNRSSPIEAFYKAKAVKDTHPLYMATAEARQCVNDVDVPDAVWLHACIKRLEE